MVLRHITYIAILDTFLVWIAHWSILCFILERRLVCFWTTKAILDGNYSLPDRIAIERVLIWIILPCVITQTFPVHTNKHAHASYGNTNNHRGKTQPFVLEHGFISNVPLCLHPGGLVFRAVSLMLVWQLLGARMGKAASAVGVS